MQVDYRYDVSPAELFAILVDPAFLSARSARYGGVGAPTVSSNGAGVEVRHVRQLPLEHVPGPFRRFVGDGRVVQIDIWTPRDDRAEADWSIDSGRAPIALQGRQEVTADGAGSCYLVTADIQVTVPVVGGRLTRQVETYLGQLIRSEQRFLADWLRA